MRHICKFGFAAFAILAFGCGIGGLSIGAQERAASSALPSPGREKVTGDGGSARQADSVKTETVVADSELQFVRAMEGQFCASQLLIYSLTGKTARVREAARAALVGEEKAAAPSQTKKP